MTFVNREPAIERFESLCQSADGAWILNFHGLPGMGKSALLRHLQTLTPSDWLVAILDFSESTLRTLPGLVVENLTNHLATVDVPASALRTYRARLRQIENNKQLIAAQQMVAKEGAKLFRPTMKLHIEAAQALATVYELGAVKQIQAWQDLVSAIGRPLLLFIDHWDSLRESSDERVQFLHQWVVEYLLQNQKKQLPQFKAIVASTRPLASDKELATRDEKNLTGYQLPELSKSHSLTLMEGWGLKDDRLRDSIYECVGGNPFLIHLAVTLCQEDPNVQLSQLEKSLDSRAASKWFIDMLVEKIQDPRTKKVLQYGVILNRWKLGTLEAVCQCDGLDFTWLNQFKEYPFVDASSVDSDWLKFMYQVRVIQARQIWQQKPGDFQSLHQKAIDWFEEFYKKR